MTRGLFDPRPEPESRLWKRTLEIVDQLTKELQPEGWRMSVRRVGHFARHNHNDEAYSCLTQAEFSNEEGESRTYNILVERSADGSLKTSYGFFRHVHEDFWNERLGRYRSRSNVVVVDNTYYTMGEEPSEENLRRHSEWYGHSGARWEIEYLDPAKGTVISHNLWYAGKIPPEYRELMPDNARFKPRESIFKRLTTLEEHSAHLAEGATWRSDCDICVQQMPVGDVLNEIFPD